MRFSKRTVSLPGFLSVSNSKLKEKSKTKSTLKQISKISIKGFNSNNYIQNSKSKKSINKIHAKNKNNNKRSSNNIVDDKKTVLACFNPIFQPWRGIKRMVSKTGYAFGNRNGS